MITFAPLKRVIEVSDLFSVYKRSVCAGQARPKLEKKFV